MSEIRIVSTTPTAEDFRSSSGSPIVINDSTDIAYYLDGSTVTPLQACGGLRYLETSATLDFGSIASNSTGTLTVTLNGAEVNDNVIFGAPSAIESGLIWCGYVSSANTITIRLHNTSGGPIDPASATWHVGVFT